MMMMFLIRIREIMMVKLMSENKSKKNESDLSLVERVLKRKKPYIQTRYDELVERFDTTLKDIYNNKTLGVITDARVGYGIGMSSYVSFFMEYTDGSWHAMTFESLKILEYILEDYQAADIDDLVGKPIYLFLKGNQCTWVEPCIVELKKKKRIDYYG
jgi:hypothetical protein